MKYALLFLLVLFTVPSFAFIVTVPDETIPVPTGTSKQIDIRVDSSRSEEITFTILDAKPWMTQNTPILRIGPDKPEVFSVFITPFVDTQPGVYKISILAESLLTGEEQKKFLFVSISKIDILEIENIDVSGNYTPTGQANITVLLKNYKSKTVRDIKVTSSIRSPSSKLIEFDQNIDSIDAGHTRNITYSFTLPSQAESGIYTLLVKISSEGETREKTRTFFVPSLAKFTEEKVKNPLVFGFSKTVAVSNIGNTKDDATVTDTLSPFEASFYSGEKPSLIRDGEFTWLLRDIEPGESRVLTYRIDYTPLFLFIIVVIIAGWLFFFKIRTVRLKKFILEKKFIEEGEEFTVGVEISNSIGRKVDSATITDFVPSVFNIKESEGPKPIRKKTAAGTDLVWKIKDLHKNEVRILSYKILPVFGIHGTIRLPHASVSFVNRKKETHVRSGYASIGIETESYGEKRFFRRKKD